MVRASHIAISFLKVQKFQKAICTMRLRSKSIGKGASGRCFFDMLISQHDLFPATPKEASSGSPFLRVVSSPWDWCRFFNMLKSQGVWYSATYVGTGPSGRPQSLKVLKSWRDLYPAAYEGTWLLSVLSGVNVTARLDASGCGGF